MTLMKRGDGYKDTKNRYITGVSFQSSTDDGQTWSNYLGGKVFPTGATKQDDANVQRKIELNPPMVGNAFRVLINPKDKVGYAIQGRFDINVAMLGEVDMNDQKSLAQISSLAQKSQALLEVGKCYRIED